MSGRDVPAEKETKSNGLTSTGDWIFRDPAKDPLEVGLQYKSMALSNVSNTDQTFTMTILEDVAIWMTKEDFDDYVQASNRRDYTPKNFVQTYVYNGTVEEWREPNRTIEGCPFHIRDVYGDGRCWVFRQRLGNITFKQPFDLKNFPFDVQDLTCMFAIYTYSNMREVEKMIVKPMYGGITFSAKFVAPNDEYHIICDHRDFEAMGGYVQCTYKIVRSWQYYFWKVVVVLALVTLTSLASFVIFESFMDQMAHLSTVLLTDVAFLYTVSEHTPRLRYLTLLDISIFGNIFFVFLIFIQLMVMELAEIDETVVVLGRLSLRDVLLIANLVVWLGVATFITGWSFWCRRYELNKLGQPYSEKELMARESKPITMNMDFHSGKPMRCLHLQRGDETNFVRSEQVIYYGT